MTVHLLLLKPGQWPDQGRSIRRISETLFEKGVQESDINAALKELEKYEENNDWKAAVYTRKKEAPWPLPPC